MTKLSISALFIFIFCFFFSNAYASGPINIEGVENLGMGGAGTAINSPKAPLYNPALLGLREGFKITIIDIPITISHDIVKTAMFIYQNMDEIMDNDDWSDLDEDLRDDIVDLALYDFRLNVGMLAPNVSAGPYPLYTGARWWDLWWGLGLYNENYISFSLDEGILIPTFDLKAQADAVVHLPFAFRVQHLPYRLPGQLYSGFAVKYMMRTRVEKTRRSIMEIEEVLEELEDQDFEPGTGIGFDLGLYYDISTRWSVAFTVRDFLGSTIEYPDGEKDEISARIDLGAAYTPHRRIELAADLRDIKFDDFTDASFFTKLHLGCQFHLSRVFKLRGGLYQGYPTAGFGIGSAINYAFYGRELGEYAGDDPQLSHTLAFVLRF